MQSIRPRVKPLVLLLVAQIGCLGLGLLGYAHFLSWSSRHTAQEAAWQELIQDETPMLPTRVALVDEQWRVLPGLSIDSSPATPPGGQTLSWTPVDDLDSHSSLVRGLLHLNGEDYVAVAKRREAGGYSVYYVPSKSLTIPVDEVTRGGQLAAWITLLWVSGLVGLVVYMIISRLCEQQARGRAQWEAKSLGQIQALQRTRDGIVFGLAKLAEFRDQETGYHLERISAFATRLATALARKQPYHRTVDAEFVRMIGVSAVLHDIGKVGVPDAILLKPGPLTAEERAIMQRHTVIGARCIAEIERRLGNSNFLRMAGEIALSHHERWNGTGYPNHLQGESIPLAARIVAMVDVYDALSSRRVYKEPLTHDECLAVIRREGGRHFDPALVEVLLEIESEIRELAERYATDVAPLPTPHKPLPRWNLARENEELAATCEVRAEELWSVPATALAN